MTRLEWSETLGKRVRTGDWADQTVPTVTKIEEALGAGDLEGAAQLIDYFMEEAKVIHVILGVWMRGFREWFLEKGVTEPELDAELDRLRSLLAFPDGTIFEPDPAWSDLGSAAGRLGNEVRGALIATDEAIARMDTVRESWRQIHDRWTDLMSGLMAFCVARFGEPELESLYRHALEPYIDERYMVYDLREVEYGETLFRNLYTTFEAMRGHLGGPERRGDMDLEEHDDRWVISFDPCGSGGRTQRGDPVEGTGPRTEPPYEFGVTKEEYDWAWNEKGVCYYCAHCCFALEKLPAERWGHPVRVVDSPLASESTGDEPKKCVWTIYKSVEAIPEEAYLRIGMTKPS